MDLELKQIEEFIKSRANSRGQITLDTIADMMLDYALRGDNFTMLIQGLQGHGKTTLALMLGARYLAKYSRVINRKVGRVKDIRKFHWKKALNSVHFDVYDIVDRIVRNISQAKRVPLIIFDDAGAWLSKWALTTDKRMFLEFYNLIRLSVDVMIFTDVSSIAKYIRDTVKLRVMVEKLPVGLVREMGLDTQHEWSRAIFYRTKMTIRGPYSHKLAELIFPLKLPHYVRERYEEMRLEYTGYLGGRLLARLGRSKAFQAEVKAGRPGAVALHDTIETLKETA